MAMIDYIKDGKVLNGFQLLYLYLSLFSNEN